MGTTADIISILSIVIREDKKDAQFSNANGCSADNGCEFPNKLYNLKGVF